MANDLTFLAILLVIKCKGAVGGSAQISDIVGEEVELAGADEESDVFETQRLVVWGLAVFARPEKVKEGNPYHINCGSVHGVIGSRGENLGMVHNRDGEGFYMIWGIILIGHAFVEAGQTGVRVAKPGEAWVIGPQFGERLHDV